MNGSKKSLTKGLGDDLFLGSYAAQYCLYLPEEASDAKGKVCELRVYNKTMGKITSVAVNRNQFDAQGCARITVPFTLEAGALNVRFQVIAQKNRQVGVSGISYWQTGE